MVHEPKGKREAEPCLLSSALPSGAGVLIKGFPSAPEHTGEAEWALTARSPLVPQEGLNWADFASQSIGTWPKPNEFHLKVCEILTRIEEMIN